MNKNEITVVIPCYNAKDTIEKCIESVYAQTHAVKEIIVIDDGSEDNTIEVLERLKRDYESHPIDFHILTQTNSGPSAARNKGIRIANAFWIAFLDADDYWTPEKLEKQIEFLNKNKNFVLCASRDLGSKNTILFPTFNQILCRNLFTTPTVVVNRDILLKIPFNEEQRFMEDQLLWLQIVKKHKIAILNGNFALQINQKAVFGDMGLSSHLWEMEKGELSNYRKLRNLKYINLVQYLFLLPFSLLKFLRRVIISKSRKKTKKEE